MSLYYCKWRNNTRETAPDRNRTFASLRHVISGRNLMVGASTTPTRDKNAPRALKPCKSKT